MGSHPGLSASPRYCFGSVSDTTVCLRARSFRITEGQDRNLDFFFFNKETKAFSLSRLSAEHQISKCSIYVRFQRYILIES